MVTQLSVSQDPAAFIRPEFVVLGLKAQTAQEIIGELAQRLEVAKVVRPTFAEAVWRREQTNPTGIPLAGHIHVAIPHADIEHVLAPALAIATLKRPVVFHNMVNPEEVVPVSIVIVMALNEAHTQVEMLQKLASLFQHPERVERLYRAQTFEEVQAALRE